MEHSENNKKHLYVRKDKNGWFNFGRQGWNARIQLCGDQRRGGFWIKQYAAKAGLDPDVFMSDLTKILALMEQDKQAIFSVYEK